MQGSRGDKMNFKQIDPKHFEDFSNYVSDECGIRFDELLDAFKGTVGSPNEDEQQHLRMAFEVGVAGAVAAAFEILRDKPELFTVRKTDDD